MQVSKVERMRGEVVGEYLNTAPTIFGSVNVACRHKPSELLAARLLNILASHGSPTTRRAAEVHHGMSRTNALLVCEESHNQARPTVRKVALNEQRLNTQVTPAPGPGNFAGFQLALQGTCMKNGRLGLRDTNLLQSVQIQRYVPCLFRLNPYRDYI